METHQCQIENAVNGITKFLDIYRDIINAYVSDYFVLNHESKVKSSWLQVLKELEASELSCILTGDPPVQRKVWPLSLLAFMQTTQALSICRYFNVVNENLKIHDLPVTSLIDVGKPNIQDGQEISLQHSFRRHVKPKKQHEIQQLAKLITSVSKLADCKHVVDVGAGQGHLSRILCFWCGLNVTTLEAADGHAPKAEQFDRELKTDIAKGKCNGVPKTRSEQCLPKHVTLTLNPNVTAQEFVSVIASSQGLQDETGQDAAPIGRMCYICGHRVSVCGANEIKNVRETYFLGEGEQHLKNANNIVCDTVCHKLMSSCGKKSEYTCSAYLSKGDLVTDNEDHVPPETHTCDKFIVAGLHACGDLTPIILRLFIEAPQATGLVSLPCCYMKMTTNECTWKTDTCNRAVVGYPLSRFIKKTRNHHLSWEAREMACHFADSYLDRLKGNQLSLQTHCYRAALQVVLKQIYPTFQNGAMKLTVKNSHQMPFQRYVQTALKKLGIHTEVPEATLKDAEKLLALWKDVVLFYVIRLSLAPVVESLILLDRVLYLKEHDIDSCLLPVFDPGLSPRNIALLAIKTINKTQI